MTPERDADRSGSMPAEDLKTWFAPSPQQLAVALAMIDAARAGWNHARDGSSGCYAVVVPLALPGKDSGIWISGQPVEYPAGYWLVRDRARHGTESYPAARDAAEDAADRHLGARPGVAAYAVVYSAQHWAAGCACGRATTRASEGVRLLTPRAIAHRASVVPYDLGHDYWRTPDGGTLIRCHSRHQGRETMFSLLFVGPDGQIRDGHRGPVVPGPRAILIAHPTVISDRVIPQPDPVTVTEGDRIETRGYVFVIRDDKPQHDPQLHLV